MGLRKISKAKIEAKQLERSTNSRLEALSVAKLKLRAKQAQVCFDNNNDFVFMVGRHSFRFTLHLFERVFGVNCDRRGAASVGLIDLLDLRNHSYVYVRSIKDKPGKAVVRLYRGNQCLGALGVHYDGINDTFVFSTFFSSMQTLGNFIDKPNRDSRRYENLLSNLTELEY